MYVKCTEVTFEMSEIIVITSGKGGVGKTTSVANIGIGLAKKGKKVVLIDADIGLRNLDILLGMENDVVYDIADVILGNCGLRQSLIRSEYSENLYLLPASQSTEKYILNAEDIGLICQKLADEFDYILIDCPAGIGNGFKNAVACANRAIVVTGGEKTAIRDADRVIDKLNEYGIHNNHILINRIRKNLVKSGDMINPDDVIDTLGVKIIGLIPDDDAVIISTNKGLPCILDKSSYVGVAYENIARRIMGESVPVIDLYKRKKKRFLFSKR